MNIIKQIKAEIERLKNNMDDRDPLAPNQKAGYLFALADVLSFLSTLESEKPVPNDLKEAAEDFVWEVMENDEDGISDLCRKLRPTSKISDFYDALAEFFIAGAKWQKKQMMKEAVEGEVCIPNVWVEHKEGKELVVRAEISKELGFKFGDKVHIIIVKEDEK